ncbi:MAG: T9SS type A sorting domain-containing protein [Cyclobacteriaceae bacterium]
MGLRIILNFSLCMSMALGLMAQTVNVDVQLNFNHTVGDVKELKRERFFTIHAGVDDRDWYESENFTDNLIHEFLVENDVYIGRNTGSIQWIMNSVVEEDPNRPGFANVSQIEAEGAKRRNTYANNTSWHAYESRHNQILCTQLHPFYPDGKLTNKGWAFSQTDTEAEPFGTASGEFYGHFIKNFFGEGGATGQPAPAFVEVTNEPLWDLYNEIDDAFRFHNAVAREVKKINPDVLIAGYCTAFPNLEEDNFQRWENRWKKFMDMSGEYMDCWSIHLYDFPSISNGKKKLRRGSNMEATFDMLEQYSVMKFGYVKPFVISEYGASSHDYQGAWTAYRDYLHNTAANAQVMQFMERPNLIGSAMNYTMLKAKWGTPSANSTWQARLLRYENEPESLTGKSIYTDRVHFYQLWSDIKGTRVDSKATHLDIQTDAYVDGNKAYVVLNNLAWENKEVAINLTDINELAIEGLSVKSYWLDDTNPVFDDNAGILATTTYGSSDIPATFEIKAEGTMIFEYTLSGSIEVSRTSEEVKYYATDYYKPISSNSPLVFEIKDVVTTMHGEAVLRLGMGRPHNKSLMPSVKVNGTEVPVPADYRGDPQRDRDTFFGVIEIDVPYELLQINNEIEVTFPDQGGHISSVAMQVFGFSDELIRSEAPVIDPLLGIDNSQVLIYPNPADDFLIVRLESSEDFAIKLYNAAGQEVLSQQINSHDRVDVSGLRSGLYFYTLSSDGSGKSGSLIIK